MLGGDAYVAGQGNGQTRPLPQPRSPPRSLAEGAEADAGLEQ